MSQGYVPGEVEEPVLGVERRQAPRAPQTLADTGLLEEMVSDLLLKTLYIQGARTGADLTDAIRLPFHLLDTLLLTLQHRQMVEVRGTHGPSRTGYIFDLAAEGRERAREALEASQYVGPAPVPLAQYRYWVQALSIRHARVTQREIAEGFNWLVLSQDTLDQVGPAVNSAKSLFLYGESGNGKTAIAETIARLLGGAVFIPYAVEVDGQLVVIHDPVYHRPVEREDDPGPESGVWAREVRHDLRYVEVVRPVVLTGGELTLDQLDLQYDPYAKMYQAPFQVKANGGVLIVDDFGRQRAPARDLLNRWIVPLEKHVDFLTLHTGGKFPVPFDCLLIFATNIDPRGLVEEAFLRRIHYKIKVESPTREQYDEIFRRYAEARDLPHDPAAVRVVYEEFYERFSIGARGCHPRDLLDHLFDIATYREVPPALSPDLVRQACRSYFLDFPTSS
jgi:predicted ATPase with chaperone activity